MDYSREQRAERLAAEYVLGTLQGGARRRFEALLPAHPRLRQARLDWERRLIQLDDAIPPVTPSPRVWAGIEQRLFGDESAGTPSRTRVRWWQRLALWQGAAGVATVAALTLAVLLSLPQPAQPPIVVVMAAQPAAAAPGVQPASFVASVSGDGRSLVLKPLNEGQQVALNKALELWAVPAKGAPRSLGLVSPQQATTVLRAHLLKDTAAFAVSVEPPGGSPTGAPTGPIVSVGQLSL
jgi:anti-sigma-K factor RskA